VTTSKRSENKREKVTNIYFTALTRKFSGLRPRKYSE